MDHFYEQLVRADKTGFYKTVKVATYVLGIIGLLIFNVNFILSIILIVAAAACFIYKKELFVEYEYQFTNGEIDIEKILEMKKRKKVTTFNIKEVTLLALEDSDAVKDFSNKPKSIEKCFSTNAKAKVYVAMVTEGTNRMQLMFMPDAKFLELCYRSNPRVVKK
ncbi:MAG: DUF6106 family protein [Clostridiaceae bacterium]|nr:DUF6106 family protein [Clostridiaceae bacterium]